MVNVENIKFIQSEPFLTFVEGLLEEKFPDTKVIKVLEIGCGPGDFTLIFKDKLKERVDITAIDPSDDIEKAKAKSTGTDVQFERGDIFSFKTDQKFDLVMFTKSLHHCNPVNKAVQLASNLLNEGGVFLAEEINSVEAHSSTLTWFFDHLDLLRSAGCMIPIEERLENAGHIKNMLMKMLDSSLPVSERWFRPVSRDQQKKHLHRDDPEGIALSKEICEAINNQFGQANIKTTTAPFFYVLLVMAGLKSNEVGEAVLKEFIRIEKRAIEEGIVSAFGLNIVAIKK